MANTGRSWEALDTLGMSAVRGSYGARPKACMDGGARRRARTTSKTLILFIDLYLFELVCTNHY